MGQSISLIPGRYGFTDTAPGFKQVDRGGITLQTADMKLIDVRLELGAAAAKSPSLPKRH